MNSALTYSDDQGVLQPRLAEAVPTVDNGLWKVLPDGRMETSWQLQPGILWHDGVAFTSADLLFSFQVYRDRELAIFHPAAVALVESVEATDPRTVLVRWKQLFIEADTMFTPDVVMPMARHALEQTYVQDKPNFLVHPHWRDEFVGTGPYRLVEWVPGSHLLMKANDQYLLGRPQLDEIEVKFIPDLNAILTNLQAGSVEMLFEFNLAVDQALSLRDRAPDLNVVLAERLGGVVPMYTQFLATDPPMVQNLEFRRALYRAIDRTEINDTLNFGIGPIADTWLQPDTVEYPAIEKQIVRYQYDPRRAAQVIEELGYARGTDGALRDASGKQLHIEIRTTDLENIHVPTALSVADYWKRLGIDMALNSIPIARMTDTAYFAVFPAFMLITGGQGLQSADMLRWVGSASPLPENQFVGRNRTRYQNPAFDAMIQRYVSTIPKPERLTALGDIINHQTDQLTILPLIYRATGTVLGSKRLKNVKGSLMWNAHQWGFD